MSLPPSLYLDLPFSVTEVSELRSLHNVSAIDNEGRRVHFAGERNLRQKREKRERLRDRREDKRGQERTREERRGEKGEKRGGEKRREAKERDRGKGRRERERSRTETLPLILSVLKVELRHSAFPIVVTSNSEERSKQISFSKIYNSFLYVDYLRGSRER
jgi:hypothetical protein